MRIDYILMGLVVLVLVVLVCEGIVDVFRKIRIHSKFMETWGEYRFSQRHKHTVVVTTHEGKKSYCNVLWFISDKTANRVTLYYRHATYRLENVYRMTVTRTKQPMRLR